MKVTKASPVAPVRLVEPIEPDDDRIVATEDRLVRLADLLRPCPRPDFEDGWDLCAHAEPWPCLITRAAWLATGTGGTTDTTGITETTETTPDLETRTT